MKKNHSDPKTLESETKHTISRWKLTFRRASGIIELLVFMTFNPGADKMYICII